MLAGLFAGIDNSTKNAAWNLVYLAANPKWKAQVLYEVEKAATKHLADTSIPLAERLSSLPLDVWETEFPTIDMVLTETIRLHLQGVQFRKHVGATNVKVGDEIIPPGAFVVSCTDNFHENADTDVAKSSITMRIFILTPKYTQILKSGTHLGTPLKRQKAKRRE